MNFNDEDQQSIVNQFGLAIRSSFDSYANSALSSCEGYTYMTEDFSTESNSFDGSGEGDGVDATTVDYSTFVEPNVTPTDDFVDMTTYDSAYNEPIETPVADLNLLQTEEEAVESSAETIVVNGISYKFYWLC